MSKVSFIKEIFEYLPKARKYFRAPEGMEIFHSTNPFVGDKLVLNGTKLANGPKTLTRELKSLGYESKEAKRLIGQCETAPELYPQMSAMLKGISPEIFSRSSARETIMYNLNELAEYGIKNPQSIFDIKNWGHFFSTMEKENNVIRLCNFLKNGITDFKTAEKLFESVSKTKYSYQINDIPQIIKESKLPKEQLTRIFDSQLKLVTDDAAYQLCQSDFRTKILNELNTNPKNAEHFADLLEKLTKAEDFNKKFDVSEMVEISKYLKEEWQIDFIKNFKDRLYKFGNIKTPEQGQIATELTNKGKYRNINELYEAISKGVLDSKESTEAYSYLTKFTINNGLRSETIQRFTGVAREDICKLVKNEQDLEILKLMAEKKNVRGEDLYDTFSIIKVLEQSPEKKAKIAEKLRTEYTFNEKAIESAHAKVTGKYLVTSPKKMNVAAAYGRIVESDRQFQQTVRQLPKGLNEAELLKQIAPGEVAEVGSKLIVSDGEKLAELKMDKAMFTKLFVTDEYLMQALLGDCGCVSTLDGLLSTPKGKSAIYQLFEQVNNDIYINLKGYDKKIKFINGDYEKHLEMARGAQGIKMLEQALAISEAKQSSKSVITAYKDLLEENGGRFANIMDSIYGISPSNVLSKIFDKGKCKYTYLYNGDRFEVLKQLNPKENRFAEIATQTNIDGVRGKVIPKWHMCGWHWHNVKGLDNYGKLKITNPHDASFGVKVPSYEVMNPDILSDIMLIELI